jgi:transposase
MITCSAGIDIGKDHLDVHLLPDGLERRFDNNAVGLRALMRWLAPMAPQRIV